MSVYNKVLINVLREKLGIRRIRHAVQKRKLWWLNHVMCMKEESFIKGADCLECSWVSQRTEMINGSQCSRRPWIISFYALWGSFSPFRSAIPHFNTFSNLPSIPYQQHSFTHYSHSHLPLGFHLCHCSSSFPLHPLWFIHTYITLMFSTPPLLLPVPSSFLSHFYLSPPHTDIYLTTPPSIILLCTR